MRLTIDRLWDGTPAEPNERVVLELSATPEGGLRVDVDAPFFADPRPAAPPGSTDRLWEHEVVELFLFGAGGRYLELELGPHGHYLVLQLRAVRVVASCVAELDYRTSFDGARWRGLAFVRAEALPTPPWRCNAHALHGVGGHRRYLSALPAGGEQPDFHRPEAGILWDGTPGPTDR